MLEQFFTSLSILQVNPWTDALSRAPEIAGMEAPTGIFTYDIQREQAMDDVIKRVGELWKAYGKPNGVESIELKQLLKVS